MPSETINKTEHEMQIRQICAILLGGSVLLSIVPPLLVSVQYGWSRVSASDFRVAILALILLLELTLLWKKDSNHIGCFVFFCSVTFFAVIRIVVSATSPYNYYLLPMMRDILSVVLAAILTLFAYFGFRKNFGILQSKIFLYIAFGLKAAVACIEAIESILIAGRFNALTSIDVFQAISTLLLCIAVILLFRDVQFYPLGRAGIEYRLRDLNEQRQNGTLSEEEYLRRRQEIISRL